MMGIAKWLDDFVVRMSGISGLTKEAKSKGEVAKERNEGLKKMAELARPKVRVGTSERPPERRLEVKGQIAKGFLWAKPPGRRVSISKLRDLTEVVAAAERRFGVTLTAREYGVISRKVYALEGRDRTESGAAGLVERLVHLAERARAGKAIRESGAIKTTRQVREADLSQLVDRPRPSPADEAEGVRHVRPDYKREKDPRSDETAKMVREEREQKGRMKKEERADRTMGLPSSKTASLKKRATENMVQITVDMENNAEEWWDAALEAHTVLPIAKKLQEKGIMVVNQKQADDIRAWAERLPGWDNPNAPEYAPHPLVFNPYADDSEKQASLGLRTAAKADPKKVRKWEKSFPTEKMKYKRLMKRPTGVPEDMPRGPAPKNIAELVGKMEDRFVKIQGYNDALQDVIKEVSAEVMKFKASEEEARGIPGAKKKVLRQEESQVDQVRDLIERLKGNMPTDVVMDLQGLLMTVQDVEPQLSKRDLEEVVSRASALGSNVEKSINGFMKDILEKKGVSQELVVYPEMKKAMKRVAEIVDEIMAIGESIKAYLNDVDAIRADMQALESDMFAMADAAEEAPAEAPGFEMEPMPIAAGLKRGRVRTADGEQVIAAWDEYEIAEGRIKDIRENIDDEQFSHLKEEAETSGKDLDDVISEYVYSDTDLWDMEYEDFTSNMDAILSEKGADVWDVEGRSMGWQNKSGTGQVEFSDFEGLRAAILPKTQQMTIHVYDNGPDSFKMTVSHHDSPTGEFYTVTAVEPQAEEVEASVRGKTVRKAEKGRPNDVDRCRDCAYFESGIGTVYHKCPECERAYTQEEIKGMDKADAEILRDYFTDRGVTEVSVPATDALPAFEKKHAFLRKRARKSSLSDVVDVNIDLRNGMATYFVNVDENHPDADELKQRGYQYSSATGRAGEWVKHMEDDEYESDGASEEKWLKSISGGQSQDQAEGLRDVMRGRDKEKDASLKKRGEFDRKKFDEDYEELVTRVTDATISYDVSSMMHLDKGDNPDLLGDEEGGYIEPILGSSYGPNLDRAIIEEMGWDEEDIPEDELAFGLADDLIVAVSKTLDKGYLIIDDNRIWHVIPDSEADGGKKDASVGSRYRTRLAKWKSKQPPKKWFNQKKKEVKKGNPDYTASQVDKTVGRIWSDLSDAKKKTIRGREGKEYGKAKKKSGKEASVKTAMDRAELERWVMNDEGLYNWAKESVPEEEIGDDDSRAWNDFLDQNSDEISKGVENYLNKGGAPLPAPMQKEARRNEDVIQMFLEDSYPKDKMPVWGTENLKITKKDDGWALVNYSTPLAYRDAEGNVFFNERSYSVSTSIIQNKILGIASDLGITMDVMGEEEIRGETERTGPYQEMDEEERTAAFKKAESGSWGSVPAGDIMRYENGKMSSGEILRMFSKLMRNGLAWKLQDAYGRMARGLVDAGYLNADGSVRTSVNRTADGGTSTHPLYEVTCPNGHKFDVTPGKVAMEGGVKCPKCGAKCEPKYKPKSSQEKAKL